MKKWFLLIRQLALLTWQCLMLSGEWLLLMMMKWFLLIRQLGLVTRLCLLLAGKCLVLSRQLALLVGELGTVAG